MKNSEKRNKHYKWQKKVKYVDKLLIWTLRTGERSGRVAAVNAMFESLTIINYIVRDGIIFTKILVRRT